jgi:DNA replication licensing factor MCM4
VSSTSFKEKFQRFIQEFKEESVEEDDFEMVEEMVVSDQPFYMRKLEEINLLEEPFLNINCSHLKHFDEDLYRQLICYPQEVVPTMDTAVNEFFFTLYPEAKLPHQIQVRPYNADKIKTMRLLNPEGNNN